MAKRYKAAELIEAIQKAEGNLTEAARILGCTRQTVHNYVNEYTTVEEAYHQENDKALDKAERALMKQIEDGNTTAIIFFLKTKGKNRGYVERQEFTGKDGDAIQIVMDR